MAQDDENYVIGGGIAKWVVIGKEGGQEVWKERCSRFADARVLALPTAEDFEQEEWRTLTRQEVEEEFANGAWIVRVAWVVGDENGTCMEIHRLVVA
jgi:hypothetical protein